jgi:predicted chitinase
VGEGNETINKLKKIINGGKRGMDDTCAKENI